MNKPISTMPGAEAVTTPVAVDRVSGHPPLPMNRRGKRLASYMLLIAIDAFAVAVAFLIPHFLYIGTVWSGHGIVMAFTLIPIFIGIGISHHAYTIDVLETPAIGIVRVLRSFLFATAAVMLIAYGMKAGDEFSRLVFGVGVALAVILLALCRLAVSHTILRFLGGAVTSVVVIVDDLPYAPQPGDGVLTLEQAGFDPENYSPYQLDEFASRVQSADRLIIACSLPRAKAWAMVLKGLAIQGEIVSDLNQNIGIIALHRHGETQTIQVAARPLGLADRLLKRLLDLIIAVPATVILTPILLGVALAIAIESRGPILFVQLRIGRDNRLFRMYKFRSMFVDRCDADAATLTARNDARVTRVGAFIRRTSVDELPQLLNVLRGDMSIVGPRPHALSAKAADTLYWDVDPRYRHRHSIKPGITGLAQVRGHRGNTERHEDLTNRLHADLEYLADWSIWRDIKIIVQTFGVLRHDNAF